MALAASLGWGSLLMSFRDGNVIFLPRCPLIDSAAGIGRGLPAWHHSLPGLLGVLGGTIACLGSHTGSWGAEAPLSIPQPDRTPLPWTLKCCLENAQRSPGDPQHPRAGSQVHRDEVGPGPGSGAVPGCRAPSVAARTMVWAGRGWLCPTTACTRRAAPNPSPGTVTATASVTPRCCDTSGALPKCCWHLLASVLERSLAPGIPAVSRCQHRTGVR